MKVTLRLPDEDLAFLDAYARDHGLGSRSAAVHRAVRILRTSELDVAYELAWLEWASDDDSKVWDQTVRDGMV